MIKISNYKKKHCIKKSMYHIAKIIYIRPIKYRVIPRFKNFKRRKLVNKSLYNIAKIFYTKPISRTFITDDGIPLRKNVDINYF